MVTIIRGIFAVELLQKQPCLILASISSCCRQKSGSGGSAAADIGHFGRHDGHELDVAFERQGGHVDDAAGDVLDIDARLGLDPAGRLQSAARGILVAGRRGVADVDLAAGDVVVAPVERQRPSKPGQRVLGRNRMAGAEPRLGTASVYMALCLAPYSNKCKRNPSNYMAT